MKSDEYREKLKGKWAVYRRSDGRQELRYSILTPRFMFRPASCPVQANSSGSSSLVEVCVSLMNLSNSDFRAIIQYYDLTKGLKVTDTFESLQRQFLARTLLTRCKTALCKDFKVLIV